MKKIFLILLIIASNFLLTSCSKVNKYYYGEKEMFTKIWESNIIYNETVVLEDNQTEIAGRLLYPPKKIISVRDYTLEKEYDPSEYRFEGNKIIRTASSTLPYLTSRQLAGEDLPEEYNFSTYQAKEPGAKIIFTEGIGIVMHQIAVTYVHDETWKGPIPGYQGKYLNNILKKLENKEKVTVVLNGDSIATGANSSGKLGIAPYLDDFGTLFINQLQKKYETEIEFFNTSLGGTLSEWGKTNVDPNINAYKPDLVIIGFGMNDGSWNIPPYKFKENIDFVIRSIKARNENTDIILLSTILANPKSIQNSIQEEYLPMLLELQTEYKVAVVDMTSLSQHLFTIKKGVDILANNINHPSDFLVRCYVSALLTAVSGEY